ncbi:hypothetical protein [Leptospira borgpetersenii]|uniref:hypothetical protein n=1 Tax=Leptospira borgpetersenii TaxID=174 RepID=UPI002021C307|nr:hypothetical protein [Leptospira borgpetersenii]URD70098.1 hypothetical protein LIX26_00625 [Leptospira borgpetersenii]
MKVGPGNKVQLGKDESLHYVGHGQLESAPASTSVLHVISHELGHVAEFRSEAMRDRAEIRSLNMKIHYEFRNGKLVAVAGETEAVTARKSEETTRKNETSWDESSKKENVPKKEEKSYISSSGLEDKEKQILLEIRKIESELQTFEAKKKVGNEQRFDSVRKVELEERKRKLEMALNQEKLKMILEDTLNTFKELIDKQARTSLRILNANASVKTGNIFDAKA